MGGSRIKIGDTATVGEKLFSLNDDGTIEMEVAVPMRKIYAPDGLVAKKEQLETELAEVNALIAKYEELSGG
jgi:hypothetical protein